MKTTASKLRRVTAEERIPDGAYPGRWGAYTVRFEVNGIEYAVTTDIGIRTINAPCTVHVKAGRITVTI